MPLIFIYIYISFFSDLFFLVSGNGNIGLKDSWLLVFFFSLFQKIESLNDIYLSFIYLMYMLKIDRICSVLASVVLCARYDEARSCFCCCFFFFFWLIWECTTNTTCYSIGSNLHVPFYICLWLIYSWKLYRRPLKILNWSSVPQAST